MPLYTKLLKVVLNKKRDIGGEGLIHLMGQCNVVFLNHMPNKFQDPGNFSIPCMVGNVSIESALCDLGTSVSILPLPIAKQLGLSDMVPTTMTLQLVDRLVQHPKGVIEDVPVKG
ncbi:uncharacterized protein LOC141641000 [Silene latifolia]|uniref:uncharacterized protein LOC141641000 n=1 Tax=Silene latifolia TaxID=37657 RepID=UPI003D77375F